MPRTALHDHNLAEDPDGYIKALPIAIAA
jgi:hypothetical protein